MSDFNFVHNTVANLWTILAPRRAKRPDEHNKAFAVCPFCVGKEQLDAELYRVGGEKEDQNWQIRVIPNKFPFTPNHELIIHSPDHHKSFGELPLEQAELILQTYRQRFQTHKESGQVYIFHNKGEMAGESVPHPHSQLTVVPKHIQLEIPPLHLGKSDIVDETFELDFFSLFCPQTSQWPDEVWIAPLRREVSFSEASDDELKDLSVILTRLIHIMNLRHGLEFPFNFYIYPGEDWYIRFIPREKRLGGFEVGTNIYVNTQDPKETFAFIKKHFYDHENEITPYDYSHHV